MSKPLKVFIVAGEASGDNLGGKLCAELKKRTKCEFAGVGGVNLSMQGVNSIFPMKRISLIGYLDVLKNIFSLLKLLKLTAEAAKKFNPDIIITIDSPGFCFALIKRLSGLKAKKVHYVAPSVWVKPKRVLMLKKYYDLVLSLLPFEKNYFEKENMKCVFVGHPAAFVQEVDEKSKMAFKKKYCIGPSELLVTAMTGSRMSEIKALTKVSINALNLFQEKLKKRIIVAFPYVSEQQRAYLEQHEEVMQFKPIYVSQKNKFEIVSASDFALVKSGTSSLEVAVAKVPMVVMYKVGKVTEWIVKNYLKLKGYISIVNILADRKIIPELVQNDCNPEKISNELIKLVKYDGGTQVELCQKEIRKLNVSGKDPSIIAAEAILSTV